MTTSHACPRCAPPPADKCWWCNQETEPLISPLDMAIANVITCYRQTTAPGDRMRNLAQRYKALYDAIEDLDEEWRNHTTTED